MMQTQPTNPTVKDIFEQVGYNITGGDEHGWRDIYPMARFLDWESGFTIVFSTFNQQIYEVSYFNELEGYELRWVRAEFRKAQKEKQAQYPKADWSEEYTNDWGTVVRDYISSRVQGHPV
jgi:hypothetical protein